MEKDQMAEEQLDVIQLEGNLADAKKPPEVPAGKYVAEIQDVEAKASDKGNKYWAVKFVISPDQLPEELRESYEDGAVLYWNRQMIPKDAADRRTIFNLKQFYTNIGLDNNITSIDPNEWMGQKALIQIKMGSWQGEARAEIVGLSPVETRPAPKAAAPAANKRRGK